jgi:Protein of unknown function (DUF2802)
MLNSGFALIAIAALLAGAALQVVLALAGFRARRQDTNQAAVIRDLQKDIVGFRQELAVLRRQVAQGGRIEPQPAAAAAVPAVRREPVSPAYELAGKLARKGASDDELMETCGLSRGEVDLITRLSRLGQEIQEKTTEVA